MKTRNGFVSNSSSSSFCIMGIVVGDKVTDEQYEKIDASSWGKDKTTNLDCVRGISEYYEQNLIGLAPSEMKNEETLLQFKERVVAEFHKVGATNMTVEDLEWHTDGGSDS